MRLWSIHPRYLDKTGLLALWRESLLAQKVLLGKTKGYKYHPQLHRFKGHTDPIAAIGFYLLQVYLEAEKRGYCFDKRKILSPKKYVARIKITKGQIDYEFSHLCSKLKKRDRLTCAKILGEKIIKPHPLFKIVKGRIASWEKNQGF
ncbi:MAG: pyrimidine dimer DNA glycosylase/endonuclease V [Candidatus Omnitrophica bacterium]|nr:pyrimidine dimer DNA glycosylase/endonuclease V [Candidatus Omnitrophota bacterium]